jgi:hypothetical protein
MAVDRFLPEIRYLPILPSSPIAPAKPLDPLNSPYSSSSIDYAAE